MKRFAISVVAAITILYTVKAFGPLATHATWSSRTIAQEPAKPTRRPDPFDDRSDPPDKGTSSEPTSPTKNDQPKDSPQRKKAKPSDDSPNEPEHPSKALEAKLSLPENFEFPDTPLQDVIDALTQKLGTPIILDKKGLEDAGIGTDKTVNVNLRGFRADKFLDLMLEELDLAWVARDGYVLITTKEKLGEQLEVRVYNCSDLIELVKAKPKSPERGFIGGFGGGDSTGLAGPTPGVPSGFPGFPGATAHGAELNPATAHTGSSDGPPPELVPDNESLIELIKTALDPDSWDDLGGNGSIAAYHGGLLVINQNGQTHRRIELLLKMMRQAKQAKPGSVIRER